MDKSNLELFKQALNDAVSNKFDKMAAECTEEIVYSDRHKLAMRTIIYGKADTKRVLSPKMRRIIAILIAVALLLTSCGIIFRNEIREIFKEFFVSLTYEGDEESPLIIKEVYTLSYVPEEYSLEKEMIEKTFVRYEFKNEKGETLFFEQHALTHSSFIIDSESGYSKIEETEEYEVYYRCTDGVNYYLFHNDKYYMSLISMELLSNNELNLILNGIKIK